MRRNVEVTAALLGAAAVVMVGCSSSASAGSSDQASRASTPASMDATSGSIAAKPSAGQPAAQLPAAVRKAGTIVAGALMEAPPVEFYTASGAPTGINADMAVAMGKRLGIAIHLKQFAFAGLQPAMKSGQIGIIWDSMNDTAAREASFDFIDYLKAGNTLLLPKGNPKHVTTLSDACGLTIATISGATQISAVNNASKDCVTAGKKPIKLKLYPDPGTARLQVRTGTVDAFIGNAPALLYIAKTTNNGNDFDAVTLKASDPASYYGIAFNKSQQQLRNAFEDAFKAIIASGQYKAILAKYGLANLAVARPMINAASTR